MHIVRIVLTVILLSFNSYADLLKESHEEYLKSNYQKCVSLLNQSCNDNNAIACSNLAILYYQGINISRNIILTKKYNSLGCNLNNYQSCANLARIKLEIDFSNESILESRKLFDKACIGGYKSACIDKKILDEDYIAGFNIDEKSR
ncbi:MAG: hypothetical protein U9O56_06780 [Campylobacterota bacterium]|nr:hypothetical protein [Campylobacterota bacterium]